MGSMDIPSPTESEAAELAALDADLAAGVAAPQPPPTEAQVDRLREWLQV